jgi:SAM-dependent MidA family methyltransferase
MADAPYGGTVLRSWRQAMADALYGESGFYRRERPAAHFRTSVHASPLFAAALADLAERVDAALGRPDRFDLVDVGAGRGELLAGILAAVPAGLRARLRPTAVEVAPRPADLPDDIGWAAEVPELTGLLVANEWLDNVPVDVVELTAAGPHLIMVDQAGRESLGPAACDADRAWLAAWWPLSELGARAEVGSGRDAAWAAAVARVRRGVAVAIDYSHTRADRVAGLVGGTLAAYRNGRPVPPVPDGSCDLTAHVALDACAEAAAAGQTTPGPTTAGLPTLLTTQRAALRSLGVHGARPPRELARTDPAGYLAALARAGQAAELTDPGGLGGFGWLVQSVGVALPL